jgi:5-deoxy-glucuronate isomerase
MTNHITSHRDGFPTGFTPVTSIDDPDDTKIGFGTLLLPAGTTYDETAKVETAWLLMTGKAIAEVDGRNVEMERESIFDQSPYCVRVAAGGTVRFTCREDCEFTVYSTANTKPFASTVYTPEEVPNEHRGKGQVGNACLRFVRTIFDGTNSDRNAELVLGEVITMPGRWSSYPPHHHSQPEIYHYRFTKSQGYGHAELGEDVVKVRQFDTVKIPGGEDHAQCAAPGYGMYYAWVIRHLPNKPYTVPDFTREHTWTQDPDAEIWMPEGLRGYD